MSASSGFINSGCSAGSSFGAPFRSWVTGDLDRALAHYGALGFETEAWAGGGYGFITRDGAELHVREDSDHSPATNTVSCYLHVADADALYAEWRAAAAQGAFEAPIDTDCGLREGRHVDPDGNVVRFGSPIRGSRRTADGSMLLAADDLLVIAATTAVQAGDVDTLVRLLGEHAELAKAQIGDDTQSRTLLHAATDWPGHFANVRDIIGVLVEHGADVDARFVGAHAETALHWAASSDDVDALDALLDAGADIEASGAVIAGGTPLTDAVAFGQWHTARRLVDRGAQTPFREAAGLGLLDRVQTYTEAAPPPAPDDITQALWYACHGGQRDVAEYLLERGADLNWLSTWDQLTPLDAALRSEANNLIEWLRALGAKSANELSC